MLKVPEIDEKMAKAWLELARRPKPDWLITLSPDDYKRLFGRKAVRISIYRKNDCLVWL